MPYVAVTCFVIALLALVLGFAGVAPGGAAIANVALLLSFVLMAATALKTSWRHGADHH